MNVQFKKGVLELCVLALLARRDHYGYELSGAIDQGLAVAEGSVYPLLKRLRDEGLVETYLGESAEGPARKYYRLTPAGQESYRTLRDEWIEFTAAVTRMTALGGDHEGS